MGIRSPAVATGIAGLGIVAAAILCYARVLEAPLVFDDVRNISENAAVRWQRIGLDELRRAAFESPTFRPVSYLSFGFQSALGAGPRGLRATNVAIHAANGLLVLALALGSYRRAAGLPGIRRDLTDPAVAVPLAGLAGLLFVVHPIQTQAVSYLVQRMTSLATLGYLAALWLWLRGGEAGAPTIRLRWRAAAVAAGLLACGAKEIAVALPFGVALYQATFLPRPGGHGKRRLLAGLGVLAVAIAALGFLATDGLAGYAAQSFTLTGRLWSAPRVLTLYASLVALPLPSRLNLLHDLPASTSWIEPPTTLPATLAWLGLCALAWKARGRARFASFALLWALFHLALESSFLPLALVFEHRLYLPMLGVAIALPAIVYQRLGDIRWTLGFGLAVAIALAAATVVRNEVWRDPVALWDDVVAKSPTSGRAHDELGLALQTSGSVERARTAFERAVELAPERAEPRTHLAWLLRQRGELAASERLLLESIRLEPGYARAWHALGLLRLAQRRPGEAAGLLAQAVALSPRDPAIRSNYGTALAAEGRADAARAQWRETLRIDPQRHQTHAQLGELALVEGDATTALRHLRAAESGDPGSLAIRNNLAWLLATTADSQVRDASAAIALAEALSAEAADDPGVLDTLAAAYAADGRFDAAERTARRAATLASAAGDADAARRMRAHAERYRAGQPLFEAGAGAAASPDASSADNAPRIYSTSP